MIAHSTSQAPVAAVWYGQERVLVLFTDASLSAFTTLTGELCGAVNLMLVRPCEVQEACFSENGQMLVLSLKDKEKTFPLYKFNVRTGHITFQASRGKTIHRHRSTVPIPPKKGPHGKLDTRKNGSHFHTGNSCHGEEGAGGAGGGRRRGGLDGCCCLSCLSCCLSCCLSF